MPWQPTPGSTLLVPSGPKGLHLHVVILGPVAVEGYGAGAQVVLASITTKREGLYFDAACLIEADEHPFVRQPSYVPYSRLRIDSVAHLQAMLANGVCHERNPCSAALLARIRAGALASDHTRTEFRRLLGG